MQLMLNDRLTGENSARQLDTLFRLSIYSSEVHTQKTKKIAKHRNSLLEQASVVWLQL